MGRAPRPPLDPRLGLRLDVARIFIASGRQVDASQQIFLHIGHYKTGSSAIQDFLHDHATDLRAHGFLYPACGRPRSNPTNHGHLSLTLARDHGFAPPPWYGGKGRTTDAAYAELEDTLDRAPERNIILSSEEFVQLALRDDPDAAVADLKARLGPRKVTVLLYVREPLALLKSWFNEVNKGPKATRSFPVFFANMNEVFLSQHGIWTTYARHFGRENIRLLTYKQVGAGHLAEFLSAIGCPLTPPDTARLVQQAQALDKLETVRLAKIPPENLGDFTLSRFGGPEKLRNTARRISEDYNRLAAYADEPQPSLLTAEAVIDHYADLLRPLQNSGKLNQKEAENLRDLAIRAETVDLGLARALMEAAQVIRPDGPFINRKLADYRNRLVP